MDFKLNIKSENGQPDFEQTYKVEMDPNASMEEVAEMGQKLWDCLEGQLMYSLQLAYATKLFLDKAEDIIKTKILVFGKPSPTLQYILDGIKTLRQKMNKFERDFSKTGVPAEQLYKDMENAINNHSKEE
ncbi:MAG: hypothetical protein J6Q61_00315 [Bacteroidales bacterium]|nr:hypothetical protein [Bacteroidales bacterium]